MMMTVLVVTERASDNIDGHACECGGTINALIWHTGHCKTCQREWILSLVLRQNCPRDFVNDDDLIPFE